MRIFDPAHGGDDPGKIGINKEKEKDINLKIARKLQKLLEKEGIKIVMTRTDEGGLYQQSSNNKKVEDMRKRCEIITKAKPVFTVSIHQNSYPDPSVKGPQVFYYADSVEGEELADCIQDQMNERLQIESPRQAKGNTTYYLLKKSPGVLNIVECGFMTNPEEAALLQQADHQEKIAEAIGEGIRGYLEKKE